jgi:hypothetical protein
MGDMRRTHAMGSSTELPDEPPAAVPDRAAPVRDAMRTLAGELVSELAGPPGYRLACAIDAAPDLTALWHLRITLMDALTWAYGERAAQHRMADLDALFLRIWPDEPVMRA